MTTRGESPSSVADMQGVADEQGDESVLSGVNGVAADAGMEESKGDIVDTGPQLRPNASDGMESLASLDAADSPWMQNMFTRIYQDLRALSKDFHVSITVPELLFFGFQSSGKTSTLSILAKTPAGTMQDGTGTRCPVRYKLTYNEDLVRPRLTVAGVEVHSFEEQTNAICRHMQGLENNSSGSKFSPEILEAEIECRDVPNLEFVDMPGLIKKTNEAKYRDWKGQLEAITSKLLTQRTDDGESFAFIPVFVREAFDVENDDGFEIKTIDKLCGDKRPDWRKDTLFVINKFDTKANRRSAELFVNYIGDLIAEGETVITCANPRGARIQNMEPSELVEHIKHVPDKEEKWWLELIGDFRRRADPFASKLLEVKEEYCGVGLMEQILIDKMCHIVKNTLPLLQSQLERREQEYKDCIARLQQDMDLDDPDKLKQRVAEFNHKFLEALREFYQGRDLASVRDFRETWMRDMENFRDPKYFKTIHQNAQDWDKGSNGSGFDGFYIAPEELADELAAMDRSDLVATMTCSLLGGVAVRRALDLWVAMISLMPFPDYTHEDILNFGDPFSGTIQGDPWIIIRNVVYHASIQLRKGCIWFGEYLRYRLKANAEIVFDTCLKEQFGNTVKPFGRGHGSKYGNNDGIRGSRMGAMSHHGHGGIGMNYNLKMKNASMHGKGAMMMGGHRRRGGKNGKKKKGARGMGSKLKDGSLDAPLIASIGNKKNKSEQDMQRLLLIGLQDYKKLVDNMVDEFQQAVEVIPADQSEILDRRFHEDIMNLADLLGELLDTDHNDGGLVEQDLSSLETVADTKLDKNIKLKDNKQRKEDAIKMRRAQETFESQSSSIQSKQMMIAPSHDPVGAVAAAAAASKESDASGAGAGASGAAAANGMAQDDISRLLENEEDPFGEDEDETDIKAPDAFDAPAKDSVEINVAVNGSVGSVGVAGSVGNISARGFLRSGRDHMYQREKAIRHPYTKQLRESRDRAFYKTLYTRHDKRKYHNMTERSTFLILKLGRVVWTCIKKHVITTAQQTLTNRVLAELKQHGERCQNALLFGIDYPQLQELVGELEEKTHIPKAVIEEMIVNNKKKELNKGVGQMNNDEIRKVYGSNIKQLQEEYDHMVKEYNAFLKKREEIEAKIKDLQDMDLTEDID